MSLNRTLHLTLHIRTKTLCFLFLFALEKGAKSQAKSKLSEKTQAGLRDFFLFTFSSDERTKSRLLFYALRKAATGPVQTFLFKSMMNRVPVKFFPSCFRLDIKMQNFELFLSELFFSGLFFSELFFPSFFLFVLTNCGYLIAIKNQNSESTD